MRTSFVCGFLIGVAIEVTTAIDLNVHDVDSIKSAASTVAYNLVSYYTGNVTNTADTLGILPAPYWWWESGAMWGTLVDYWYYTGDSSYNDITYEALLSQVGTSNDFMMASQATSEGNDDQSFWGFAAMSAAEKNFTAPPSRTPSWLKIVTNLWNTQMARWDTTTCAGGLKWQIYSGKAGYDYKNSIANGAFFQLSARLAHFTGNSSYVAWAERSFDWATTIGLISADYNVFDGTNDLLNCSEFDHTEWTYTLGAYLYGAAVMYNYTNGSSIWQSRTAGLLAASSSFFNPFENATDIMYEPSCELDDTCDTDQYSFKAYLSRFMWATAKIAPFTSNAIHTILEASATGAAEACIGGTCGAKWYIGGSDGTAGVGQQLGALEVIQGLLVNDTKAFKHYTTVHLSNGTNTTTQAPIPSPTFILSADASVTLPGIAWLSSLAIFVLFFT